MKYGYCSKCDEPEKKKRGITDKERLDWLQKEKLVVGIVLGNFAVMYPLSMGGGYGHPQKTIRKAIDAELRRAKRRG